MIETTHKVKCDRCGLVLDELTDKEYLEVKEKTSREFILWIEHHGGLDIKYKILCTKCEDVTNRLVRELMPVRKMRKFDNE